MDPHRFAAAFRAMTDEEFAVLKADIEKNGLESPITVFEGKILDGVNRYRACRELGIEPRMVEFKGTEDEAEALVDTRNYARRHLSASERGRYAAKQADLPRGRPKRENEPNGPLKTIAQAAKEMKVSPSTVKRAKREMRAEAAAAAGAAAPKAKAVPKPKAEPVNLIEDDEPKDNDPVDRLHALIRDGQRFGTILADPPWGWEHNASARPYPTNVTELMGLPIRKLAAKDAFLHLWIPAALVFYAVGIASKSGTSNTPGRCSFRSSRTRATTGSHRTSF